MQYAICSIHRQKTQKTQSDKKKNHKKTTTKKTTKGQKDKKRQKKNEKALHTPDDPPSYEFLTFPCTYVFMWVYVFYMFFMGLAKLHCGATPPSVMVLF